jgi:hypothetical protein
MTMRMRVGVLVHEDSSPWIVVRGEEEAEKCLFPSEYLTTV